MLRRSGCFFQIPTLDWAFLAIERKECFPSLIILVETIPEAWYSSWHLVTSSCLVLLVKQVWMCHQPPDQFTLPCISWPWTSGELRPCHRASNFHSLEVPVMACPCLKGKDIGYLIFPFLNSQFSVIFHFLLQKWLGALLAMAFVPWPGHITMLSGLTSSYFSVSPLTSISYSCSLP